jgi:hypothetical protein
MPFFIVSGLTQYHDELVSQSKYSDGVEGPAELEDGDTVSVGVPDGVPESLALPDTALELSDTTLVPALLASVEEAPVVGPVIPLLSLIVTEEKLIVETVVGEAPVDGPVMPLLSLTVIEEKLAVAEAPVDGPTMPLLSLTVIEEKLPVVEAPVDGPFIPLLPLGDIEPKLTVNPWEVSGGAYVPYDMPGSVYATPGPNVVGHTCLLQAATASEADKVTEAVPVRLQPDRVPVSIAVAH